MLEKKKKKKREGRKKAVLTPYLIMLSTHAFPFPRDISLYFGPHQSHIWSNQTDMAKAFLHHDSSKVCILCWITGRI